MDAAGRIEEQREMAVYKAWLKGVSIAQLARWSGMSRTRIWEVVVVHVNAEFDVEQTDIEE